MARENQELSSSIPPLFHRDTVITVESADPSKAGGEQDQKRKNEEQEFHDQQNQDNDEEAEDNAESESQTDLLLDIAMTTAFASILNGTPIMDARSLASFLCIFALVWWIWASQVAYNARFREFDWPHRVFMLLQLLIFCAFAAFTSNFDIENNIVDDSGKQAMLEMLRQAQGYQPSTITAATSQENRLPVLNIRGISMTMALSRLQLLVQYFYAMGFSNETEHMKTEKKFWFVQNGTLIISLAFYIAAFIVIGNNPSRNAQIASIVLWFLPIILEVIAHFIAFIPVHASRGKERSAKTFRARSATVFIIILGAGLDQITQGFHFMVGNLSFGPHRIGIILCACIIFILLFTLYFTTIPEPPELQTPDEEFQRKDLFQFFSVFVFLCAIIITLQGVAAMLQVGNVGDSIQTALRFLQESERVMNASSTFELKATDYDGDTIQRLMTEGYVIEDLLATLNPSQNNDVFLYQNLLQVDMRILAAGLQTINALSSDSQSLVTNEINAFLATSKQIVNKAQFVNVVQTAITTAATPAVWYFPVGGAILIVLAAMNLIRHEQLVVQSAFGRKVADLAHRVIEPARKLVSGSATAGTGTMAAPGTPRTKDDGRGTANATTNPANTVEKTATKPTDRPADTTGGPAQKYKKYVWIQIISRFLLGIILVALVALDQHASTVTLDENYQYNGSRIWKLATQSWVLPPYALVLLVEQLWEFLLVYRTRPSNDKAQ